MATRTEKLQMSIAIIGLVPAMIALFSFITGAPSIPAIHKKVEEKPKPVVIVQKVPVPVVQPKVDSPGDKLVAPVKNGVNWVSGRLKKPSATKDLALNQGKAGETSAQPSTP